MRNPIFLLCLLLLISFSSFVFSQSGWNQVTVPQSGTRLRGIFFVDVNSGVVDRWKTTNSGINWYQTNSTSCFAMTFPSSTTGYRITSAVRKTTNFGENWVLQNIPISTNFYGIYFSDNNNGYASGDIASIIKTTNGGTNWVLLSSGVPTTYFLYGVYFIDANSGFVTGSQSSSYEGVILKTINGGVNWSIQNFASGSGFKSVFFINSNTGFVGGAGKIFKTTDAGNSWVEKTSPSGSFLNSIIFKSPNIGYMAGWGGTIIKTTDGGETWFQQDSGPAGDLESVYFINDNTGFVCGDNGIVLKTTDGGGPPIGITPIGTEVPEKFSLSQNYPNPFNPVTNINFSIPQKSFVKIIIYDAAGKIVDGLVNFELNAGTYKVDWQADDFPSGVYFYLLQVRQAGFTTGDYKESKKMILIK